MAAMRLVRFGALVVGGLFAACGGGQGGPEPLPCVACERAYAMPHPLWGAGADFAPPAGDRAVGLLAEMRPGWAAQLDRVDGWPRLPTVILPLSAPAAAVDADGLLWFGAAEQEPLQPLAVEHRAELLNGGRSLLVAPSGPLPPGVQRVVLVVSPGAVAGARALAVCAADGTAHPDYAAAAAALPADTAVELALPFSLATSHRALPAWWARLGQQGGLRVAALEARALDALGDAAPPPAVAELLAPQAALGVLALPELRGPDGTIALDASGTPQPVGETRPGIAVALPAAGEPPYPLVLFQHGGGQDKLDLFQLAGPLAAAGFALAAIDLPYHGDRAPAGGGSDLDMLDFDDLLATRDNFRQAAADHMAVLAGIPALNAALESTLGVTGALDEQRLFYMGLSLGAISGSLTFASSRELDAAALFVGAGGFSRIVRFGFFSLLVDDILAAEPIATEVVLGLAEVLLDGADPHAYARTAEDRDRAPRPVLFFQAVDEAIISHPVSDAWARAFGADLAVPYHHPVSGMAELPLPAAANFGWPDDAGRATRILFQNPMTEQSPSARHGALITLPYTQQQVAHCFAGVSAGTGCEAIDSGYAQH
jgi:dienelactone hydrolase